MPHAKLLMMGVSIALMPIPFLSCASKGEGQPARVHSAKEATAVTTIDGKRISESGHDITRLDQAQIEHLARKLSPEERRILLDKGTERAFCGGLLDTKEKGAYTCRLCGLPLFSSEAKFKSGTGWPSFFQPVDSAHIHNERDASGGMVRTEIQCARCRSHLGHVFEDGPQPTGLRHCLNSAALRFHVDGAELPPESRPIALKTAYFAGGCFWGIEDRFQKVPGVVDAVSGYMGGEAANPTYKQVCSGGTNHAEAVRLTYDATSVSYQELLEWFFKLHDPTQLNRQGPDIGSQYRSAIFASDQEQLKEAEAYIKKLDGSARLRGRKIVTRLERAGTFHEAEAYHQNYHAKHGGSCPLPGR
jgi:peptide methionine sulfoxide reductase msrA/msrB